VFVRVIRHVHLGRLNNVDRSYLGREYSLFGASERRLGSIVGPCDTAAAALIAPCMSLQTPGSNDKSLVVQQSFLSHPHPLTSPTQLARNAPGYVTHVRSMLSI
jgi:hypothetical protein